MILLTFKIAAGINIFSSHYAAVQISVDSLTQKI